MLFFSVHLLRVSSVFAPCLLCVSSVKTRTKYEGDTRGIRGEYEGKGD